MPHAQDATPLADFAPRPAPLILIAAGAVAGLLIFILLAGRSGDAQLNMTVPALLALLTSAPFVIAWLLAAGGFGAAAGRWLLGNAEPSRTLRLAVGVAVLLTLDAALGRLGVLNAWNGLGAWLVLAGGWALLIPAMLRAIRSSASFPATLRSRVGLSLALAAMAAPAVAVLLLAATSAPGWLWASEFGGYDALSYHLQLPKEWLALGRIEPLEHNVYGFLPGYVEAAYLHLMILRGDAINAAVACQALHAVITVLAALLAGELAGRWIAHLGATARAMVTGTTIALVLGTPWTIIIGSLAYNEMAVTMLLAAGLLIVTRETLTPAQRGAAGGLLAAAACGAKLTAVGFVAAPIALALLLAVPTRQWWRAAAPSAVIAIVVLAPWLLVNAIAAGNPVFPFATAIFGSGHWTAEQVAIWSAGHAPPGGLMTRLTEAWHQFGRFGIGATPYAGEPWKPQWSILPWLALTGAFLGLLRPNTRRSASMLIVIVILQLAFWLLFTHIKSRFMLPAVVPLAALAAISIGFLLERLRTPAVRLGVCILVATVLLGWSLQSAAIYRTEAGGAPAARVGLAPELAGRGLPEPEQKKAASFAPSIWINTQFSENDRVLFVGEAAPFYYEHDFAYQTTWDRGPLSRAMATSDRPADWFESLRAAGFTHLLIQPVMLKVWARSGWNDPDLTANRLIDAAEREATLVVTWPGGERLYRLTPRR